MLVYVGPDWDFFRRFYAGKPLCIGRTHMYMYMYMHLFILLLLLSVLILFWQFLTYKNVAVLFDGVLCFFDSLYDFSYDMHDFGEVCYCFLTVFEYFRNSFTTCLAMFFMTFLLNRYVYVFFLAELTSFLKILTPLPWYI